MSSASPLPAVNALEKSTILNLPRLCRVQINTLDSVRPLEEQPLQCSVTVLTIGKLIKTWQYLCKQSIVRWCRCCETTLMVAV